MRISLAVYAAVGALAGCTSLKAAPSVDAGSPRDGGGGREADGSVDGRVSDSGADRGATRVPDGGGGADVRTSRPDAGIDAHREDAPVKPADAGADAKTSDAGADAGSGVCTATTCTVVAMADNLLDPIAVAVDSTYLYWLEFGSRTYEGYGELVEILKTSPCTSSSCYGVIDPMVEPSQVADNALMAVGPGGVCYTETYDDPAQHSVFCFPFDVTGYNKVSVEQGVGVVGTVWVGDAGAVWAVAGSTSTSTDGAVRSGTFAGAISQVATSRAQPWAVTSDGHTVYWTELGVATGQGAVYASEPDGGVRTLATAQSTPQSIALYGGYVYWANTNDGTVRRAATAPPSAVEPVASGLTSPIAVAVDESGIYVADVGSGPSYLNGAVLYVAAPGATPMAMLPDQANLGAIALDETYVYAAVAGTTAASGTILRLPKRL